MVAKGQHERAQKWCFKWRGQTNPADWFLDIQGNETEGNMNRVGTFATQNGMRVMASHPCYFLEEADADAFRVARAIRDGMKAENRPLTEEEQSYFLQSPEQMLECFKYKREALENTQLSCVFMFRSAYFRTTKASEISFQKMKWVQMISFAPIMCKKEHVCAMVK